MRKTFAVLLVLAAVTAFTLPAAALPSCSCLYCESHQFQQCWSFENGSTTFCFFYLEQYCWSQSAPDDGAQQLALAADCGEALTLPAAEPANDDLDRFLAELAAG